MKFRISILLCVLAVCQVQGDETIRVQPRIIGTDTTNAKTPEYNVAFFVSDSPNIAICSGAVIHYKWIVTAASCVKKYAFSELKFKNGGDLSGTGGQGGQTGSDSHFDTGFLIYQIIPHPSYVETTRTSDIALVNTLENIIAQPYKITRTNPIVLNLEVLLRGYGPIDGDTSKDTAGLSEASTTLRSISQCRIHDTTVPTNKLCSLRGRICKGDQGGALVLKSSPNELIGIISVSAGVEELCGLSVQPIETYTNIFLHRQWIIQTLGLTNI